MRVSESLTLTARALAVKAESLRHEALRMEQSARSFAVYALYGAKDAKERALLEAESARLGEASVVAENRADSAAELATQLQGRAQRLAVRGE